MIRKGVGTVNSRRKRSILSTFVKMTIQVGSVSPKLFIINYVFAILDGILSAQSIIWLQRVFESVSSINKSNSIHDLVSVILIWLAISITADFVNGCYNICGEEHALRSRKKLGHRINHKIGRLEAIAFEQEDCLKKMKQSYRGSTIGRNFVNTFLTAIGTYIPYYFSLLYYLYSQKPSLIFIIIIILLLSMISQITKSKLFVEEEEKTGAARRKMEYYMSCMSEREYVKDTKFFSLISFFKAKVKDQLDYLIYIRKQACRKAAVINAIIYLITFAGYIAIVVMLFYYLSNDQITIGLFAGLFCSIDSIFETTNSAVEECISYGMELRGKVEQYLDFLEMKEKKPKTEQIGEIGTIRAENLSFTYPNVTQTSIDHINLQINVGEHVAIVGENGSGKTTLARLLTGIFLTDEGKVTYNDKDISICNRYTIYDRTTGVFQTFGKYKMSLWDNIRISASQSEFNDKKVTNLLHNVGLTPIEEQFPNGFSTMLAKEYGGIDLSGGQWNRIAIARGIYREHEFIVLDEPTAAIDPIEEKRLYELFAQITKNKTSVMITHRLGSVKIADKIIVMDHGKIVGYGSHQNLLDNCEKYRTMWEVQKLQYANDN